MTMHTRLQKYFLRSRWGAERSVARAQTREQGPPSVSAEICIIFLPVGFKYGCIPNLNVALNVMKPDMAVVWSFLLIIIPTEGWIALP